MIVAALDALESLNRELLYLFVAGPGQGEGIAVALPGAGWLLVDGCTTGKNGKGLALLEIVTRWRAADDDPITAMVLTHPHQDHAGGFAELIEDLEPQAIAVAGDLLDAAKALELGKTSSDRQKMSAALNAIRAIDRWREDHPGKLVKLEQGALLSVEGSAATVTARAPNAVHLKRFLTDPGVAQRLRKEANHISLVLELEYGAARIVLTGDLPRYRPDKTTVVPSGWDQVLNMRADLGDHLALKIPHHGSAAAMHPNLMPANGRSDRAWIATPYNSSTLPRVADMDGLPRLLELQPSILLTGVPASKTLQAAQPSPGIVRLVQLASRYASQPVGEPFLDAASIELTPGDACEPLDSVWALALDRAGTVVGKWRGRAALEVIP